MRNFGIGQNRVSYVQDSLSGTEVDEDPHATWGVSRQGNNHYGPIPIEIKVAIEDFIGVRRKAQSLPLSHHQASLLRDHRTGPLCVGIRYVAQLLIGEQDWCRREIFIATNVIQMHMRGQ